MLDKFKTGEQEKFRALNEIILSNFANKERDVPLGVELLFESKGIELTDQLSIDYINSSLDNLQSAVFSSNS